MLLISGVGKLHHIMKLMISKCEHLTWSTKLQAREAAGQAVGEFVVRLRAIERRMKIGFTK